MNTVLPGTLAAADVDGPTDIADLYVDNTVAHHYVEYGRLLNSVPSEYRVALAAAFGHGCAAHTAESFSAGFNAGFQAGAASVTPPSVPTGRTLSLVKDA